MSNKKWMFVIMLGLILFLGGCYMALDWSRFFPGPSEMSNQEYLFSRIAKLLVSLLCALMVWTIGNDGLDSRDTRRMKWVFAVIFLADILFFLKIKLPGIAVFGAAQILLALRIGAGLPEFFRSGGFRANRRNLILKGIGIVVLDAVLLSGVFYPLLKGNFLFYMIAAYSILICSALWIAWASPKTGAFPGTNSRLIAAGMTLFYLGDMNVGMTIAVKSGLLWLVPNSLVWVFYAPALGMLALSAYDFRRMAVHSSGDMRDHAV